jgi:hypothetical protein
LRPASDRVAVGSIAQAPFRYRVCASLRRCPIVELNNDILGLLWMKTN